MNNLSHKKPLLSKNKKDADVFDEAMNLFHENKRFETIKLFEDLRKSKKLSSTLQYNMVLGILYRETNDLLKSFACFKKAVKLSSENELASQCLYIAYVKLGKYLLAINELDRYLKNHPAKSYKTTLRELLGEIRQGNATDFKNIIFKYCKKNNIKISNKTMLIANPKIKKIKKLKGK